MSWIEIVFYVLMFLSLGANVYKSIRKKKNKQTSQNKDQQPLTGVDYEEK